MSKFDSLFHFKGIFRYLKVGNALKQNAPGSVNGLLEQIAKRKIQNNRWKKFGLWKDDLIIEEHDVTQQALKRVPKEVLYGRYQRQKVALHYSLCRKELPESQWVTPQQDKSYLLPFIEQVLAEHAEREKYDSDIWARQAQ
ncbi:hypothetical protein MIR68_001526 [Amoeboaphelidium protococcarum]|nr:hypothetical protein MIR68_001526 [Amoeboaphelidium protococcarum]KAI3642397.1 hypothetical protein MP228_011952 [Amoeboaphelidium protococcarum]